MTAVQHKLSNAVGVAAVNVMVPCRLAGNGFVDAAQREIISTAYAWTDPTGAYSFDLTPQSQIDPAGTHYEVTHPGGEVLAFVVSDAPGPLWVKDLLVSDPAQPSPFYLSPVLGIDGGNAASTVGGFPVIDGGSAAGF